MADLNVSDIQHFSTGDGAGIRTTVFLKGCNLHCPWCHNPETIDPSPQALLFPKANKTIVYGRRMRIDEILADVMEDEAFYRASGGGVTVSGGEPLLQSEGIAEFAARLKEKGISVLLDTAGDVPWSSFERVLDVTDQFYFDWKTDSKEVYARVIGGNRERIYHNLCRLLAMGKDVHIRIPLIPAHNTSDEACFRMREQLREAGATQVDLLPFHRMGSGKYEAMGRTYIYRHTEPLSEQVIAHIAEIYQLYFRVTVER